MLNTEGFSCGLTGCKSKLSTLVESLHSVLKLSTDTAPAVISGSVWVVGFVCPRGSVLLALGIAI